LCEISKPAENVKKHGVDFSEAMTVFGDPLEVTISDPDHSESEVRFLSLGMSASGRLLVVSYTERDGRTRIINTREATSQERKQYESQTFTIRAILTGSNGQPAAVVSVWFIRAGETAPRFVTAYPGDRV
jgi:uncharacterized DUF497 family protein